MSQANTAKPMTIKSWLRKSTSPKLSALAFLQASRQFLETGELASLTSPILRRIDQGELMPTPALPLLQDILLTHSLQVEARKAEAKLMAALDAEGEGGTAKPWEATIYDAKGDVQTRLTEEGKEEDLQKSFALASEADRWTDRRLFEGASDWYGVIQHATITRSDGEPISTVVMRQDALARILKAPKSPFSKKTGTRDNKLSFGVKVQQSHAKFSHG